MLTVAVLDRLQGFHGLFRARDARQAGVSWRDLYRLRDSGELLEISRGLYRLAGEPAPDQLDFVVVCARAPRAMICLDSALAYWDFSDEIPTAVHFAVPKGTHRPAIDHPPTVVHVFDAPNFDIGRERHGDPSGPYSITSRERSVVDAVRLKRHMGETVGYSALRRYLAQRGAKPARLVEMARKLGVESSITDALRILTS